MEKSISISHYCFVSLFIYALLTEGIACPYDRHKDPKRFIQYTADGRPFVHKCPPKTYFNKDDVCGCVEKRHEYGIKCPPDYCDKRSHINTRNFDNTFFEQLVNEQWVTMICAPGTAFDPYCCQCSIHIGVSTG